MDNRNLLTGAVMLETMWKTRKKDLLDLISPFVVYSASKVCSPGEIVDQQKTLDIVKSEFGYVDMPLAIVQQAMKRSTYFKRENKKYRLTGNLDATVANIEKRRDECEKKIQTLSDQLVDYFEVHSKYHRRINSDQATQYLQDFFTRQGIFFGTNRLEEHADEIKIRETDYYIAQYLYEKKDAGAIEYNYALDLVKGYFLQSALYLQSDNGSIVSSTYRNVSFYYDTPFLLRLLGYKTEEENEGAIELHEALKAQGAKTFYFPQTQHEIEGILYAYQKSIGVYSPQTLEGLDHRRYTSSDVDRIRHTWETKLNSQLKTNLASRPEYQKNASGEIDVHYVIDERELEETLNDQIKWNNVDAMNADLESVLGIHKLRGNVQSSEIEHCKAVFVTTNGRLASVVNRYYRDNVNSQTFPIIITDSDLAALTWIKCGSTGSLPERQLLRNAYMASQPAPELIEKFSEMLEQMQQEGKITAEVAVAMRASSYAKKELLFASFEDENEIDENFISKIEEKLKEKYSSEAIKSERQKAEEEREKERHNRLANADQRARNVAAYEKKKVLSIRRKISTGICIAIILLGLIGLVVSIIGAIPRNSAHITALLIFVILSGLSTIDTVRGKGKVVDRWILRSANRKYDEVYENKKSEYKSIADGNDEVHG